MSPKDSAIFKTINFERQADIAAYAPDKKSNYGLQMAYVGNHIYGVTTLDDKSLAWTSSESDFRTYTALPAKYKALGRPAVTTSGDRIYVAYRGTNDGVYLVYTEDTESWTDLGRIGSQYAKTAVAPAIQYCLKKDEKNKEDVEKVIVVGVGADKYIYYTSVDFESGKRDGSWTKIDGTGTQSALSLTKGEDDYGVTLVHTAYNNGAFWYNQLNTNTGSWSKLTKVVAPDISSGPSAVLSNGLFAVAFKGKDGYPCVQYTKDLKKWSDEKVVWPVKTLYQLGMLGTNSDRYRYQFFVSVAIEENDDEEVVCYRRSMTMDEKRPYISDKESEDWNCKWQEKEQSNGLFGKLFCC